MSARQAVVRWERSMFVDGWAWATLACGHRVEQKNRRRPKSKSCSRCWHAGKVAALEAAPKGSK